MNQLSDWLPESESESVESLAEDDGTIIVSSVQKPNYEQVLFPLQ